MANFQKFSYFLLRIGMGILFFRAGWVKITDPSWSAAGYISGSEIFVGFYGWLATSNILPAVNFLNEWGLTLIGAALILGIFVRLSSFFGLVIMILSYLPAYPSDHGLVDEHIIYTLVFLVFMSYGAGKILTFNNWIQTRLHPMWHKWVD